MYREKKASSDDCTVWPRMPSAAHSLPTHAVIQNGHKRRQDRHAAELKCFVTYGREEKINESSESSKRITTHITYE